MNRAALEAPFPRELIKTRKGSFGAVNYVEAAQYIRRLNDAFEGQWSWRILSREIGQLEVYVHGVLQAEGLERHAFGGSSITVNKATGEIVSIADDLKAAATDALKKCCSLFGIGLDLYAHAHETPTEPVAATASVKPATIPGRQTPLRDVSVRADQSSATEKQLKAIYAIGSSQGLSERQIQEMCKERFGVELSSLGRKEASVFIGSFGAR